ncbi:hypothetical protein AB4851_08240 [Burkholderia sp. 22PA0099]|uniref:hypothetical protein n=1 Tax=Burkholderia sp. 22PA0099 TaxID=3237372 RepID=UPI0039C28D5C
MSKEFAKPPPPRLITDTAAIERYLAYTSQGTWPLAMTRFKLFARARDEKQCCYRAVTWDKESRLLYVLRLVADGNTPLGTGHWERWHVDAPDKPLDDAYVLATDSFTPPEIRDTTQPISNSSTNGMDRRRAIVKAYCYVDLEHETKTLQLFNPLVLTDPAERAAALRYVYESMGQQAGFQTTVLHLFHRYCAYGGSPRALAKRTAQQGAPNVSRVGINKQRPGAKSDKEAYEKACAVAFGSEPTERVGPCRPLDIRKFISAVIEFHIDGKLSLAATYAHMVKKHYAKYAKRLVPGLNRFYHHVREYILEKTDAKSKRLGPVLQRQHEDARTGDSSHMTFDNALEIVDVDGFTCKMPVAAEIDGKIVKIPITVIFAVSRRTGAVVGYEIALKHERSESFRRCIANIYVDKKKRAKELGLTDMRGFAHGSIDGIFVDNGAGKAEDVAIACDEMRLIKYFAPPRRGDLKAVGESLNNMMMLLMLELVGAYTRRHDAFSQELRKIKRKDDPITVEQFETFLLMAIQHINRFSNKRHLRTAAMREGNDSASIHPISMWRWYQRRRRADQYVELTEEEAWERFIPWKPASVFRGKVRRYNLSWWSTELTMQYNQHRRRHANPRAGMQIEVKRVGCHATKIKWRIPGTNIHGDLALTPRDALRVGTRTWKTWEDWNKDDDAQEDDSMIPAAISRSNLATPRPQKQVTAKQQAMLDENRRQRGLPVSTILKGKSVADARRNAAISQDAHRFATATNNSMPVSELDMATASVIDTGADVIIVPSEGQIGYEDDLAARLRAAANERDTD